MLSLADFGVSESVSTPKVGKFPSGPEDYSQYISEASKLHGVDEGLIRSVIAAESNFNPKAISPKGAQGLMQLMPGTAGDMGVVDAFNPRENIMGGVKYLNWLKGKVGDDPRRIVAAYNAGPGGNFNNPETRNYVEKVMKGYSPQQAMASTPLKGKLSLEDFGVGSLDAPMPEAPGVGSVVSKLFNPMDKDRIEGQKDNPLYINKNIVPAFNETVAHLPENKEGPYNEESPFLGTLGGIAKGTKDATLALAGGAVGFAGGALAGLPAAISAPFSGDPALRLQQAARISGRVAEALAYEPSTRIGELAMMPFEVAFGTAKGAINKVVEDAYGEGADPEKVKQVQEGANYLFDLAILGHGAFKGKAKDAKVEEVDAAVLKDAVDNAVKESVDKVEGAPTHVEPPSSGVPADGLVDIDKFQKDAKTKEKVDGMSRATFPGNQDVVDSLRAEAVGRKGRRKTAYNNAADYIAGLGEDVSGVDLTDVKGFGEKTKGHVKKVIEGRKVEEVVPPAEVTPTIEPKVDVAPETGEAPRLSEEQIVELDSQPPVVESVKTPQELATSIDPNLKFDGTTKGIPGVFDDLHSFTMKLEDGKEPSFSVSGEITPEKIAEARDKTLEKFRPKEEVKPTLDINPEGIQKEFAEFKENVPTPVYDDISKAKGEGYTSFMNKRFPDEPSARKAADKKGEGFEVVQVGDKYRVAKYVEIDAQKFDSIRAVEDGGWELMSEISREQAKGEVPSEGFGIVEVDGKYYRVSEKVDMPEPADMKGEAVEGEIQAKKGIWEDEVSPEDWAVLKSMTDEATWKEVTARENLTQAIVADKKSGPETKGLTTQEKVAKYQEWKDSYVAKYDKAIPGSEKKAKVKNETLAPLDDNFKIFDSEQAARDYLDAIGSDREIIPDKLTGKYMLEPELKDITDYSWEKDVDMLRLEDVEGRGEVRDYELSDTGTRSLLDIFGDETGSVRTDILKELFTKGSKVIKNDTGAVDLMPIRLMVDKLEKIVRTSSHLKLTPDEYLKSINVPIDIRDQYNTRIAQLPNMRMLLRENGNIVDRLLNPEPSEIAQFGKKVKKGGEYVAQNFNLTKDDIAILEGSDRRNTHGTILTSIDPRTGKEVVTLQRNLAQKAMSALDTSINVASRLGMLGLRTEWRESKAAYKKRHQELHNELMNLRKQFTPAEIRDIGIVAMTDMKGSKEAFEAMGITDVPVINEAQKAAISRVKEMVNLLDEVNYVRTRTGRAPIPKLLDVNGNENYLPLMRAIENLNRDNRSGGMVSLDNRVIAQLAKNYNGMFNPNALRRGKGYVPIEMDIFKVASRSLDYNLKEIYIAPVAAKAFAYANAKIQIPGMKEGTKAKVSSQNPALHEFLINWANNIMGNDEVAAALEHRNKAFKTGIPLIMRNVVTAMIGGSLRTVLIQPTSLLGTMTVAGLPKTVGGIVKVMTGGNWGESGRAIKKSNHLPIREFDSYMGEYADYVSKGLIRGWTRMAGDISLKPMAAVDLMIAKTAWHTSYDHATKKLGLRGKEAINFADDLVEKTQGSGDKGAVSPIQSNMGTAWLATLQTFAISDFNFIASDVLGIKNPDVSNLQTVSRVIKYVIGTQLIAMAYKSIGMENVVPDPISAYQDEKDKGSGNVKATAMAAMEVVEKVPVLGSALKYGSSVMGPVGEWGKTLPMALKDSVKILDYDKMSDKQFFKYKMDMARAVGFTFGIPGTSQVIKSIKAAKQGKDLKDIILGLPDYKGTQRGSGGGPEINIPSPPSLPEF